MNALTPATGADLELATRLLVQAKLPTDILSSGRGELWVMRDGERSAVGGFEFYGSDALLRSIAVEEGHRHAGFGAHLVDGLLALARERGVRRVWLLTETAEPFFRKRGFIRVERSSIDNTALLGSPEFTHVCSTTAVCMMKHLS